MYVRRIKCRDVSVKHKCELMKYMKMSKMGVKRVV